MQRDRGASLYEELDDVGLIVLSWDEPEAFGVLFERHAESFLGYFARRTLDAEAAAELTAETFAQAFASRRRFRDKGADGMAWLYGIGKNLLSRYFRSGAVDARARRRLGMPERTVGTDDYERIEELIDFDAIAHVVRGALAELPVDQREAVRLRIVDELSYRQVAEKIGVTEQTARARVSRGLRQIAKRLGADGTLTPDELERERWKHRSGI
ncbi:MAG TPA: sigma-70 family RNA polymerase sigma factor [Actinomycetota bacterium]|nr:sigma-70 family RNA polymerase sigma factor [Actinomycetota bacterium]